MKRSVLVFTMAAGFAALTLSSYEHGPAFNGQGDRTGGPSSGGTCSSSNCHSGASSSTTVAISLFDITAGTPNSTNKYVPGHIYEVSLNGTIANSASFPEFGFQATVLKSDNTQAGSYTLTNPSHREVTVGSKTMVEHNIQLTASGSVYNTKFNWTAPAAGTGPVTVYAIMNAVNGDHTRLNDQPGLGASLALTENTSSTGELRNDITVTAYPNPAGAALNLRFGSTASGSYSITAFDIAGQVLFRQQSRVDGGSHSIILNTETWTRGTCFVRIANNAGQRIIPVVKQ